MDLDVGRHLLSLFEDALLIQHLQDLPRGLQCPRGVTGDALLDGGTDAVEYPASIRAHRLVRLPLHGEVGQCVVKRRPDDLVVDRHTLAHTLVPAGREDVLGPYALECTWHVLLQETLDAPVLDDVEPRLDLSTGALG